MATRSQADDAIRRLARVRTSTLAVGITSSVAVGLVVAGLVWAVLAILDMGLGLGGLALRLVAVAGLAIAVGVTAYSLVKVLRVSHSIRSYAARVGTDLKEVGLDLVALLDLASIDNRKFGYSDTLLARAIEKIADRVAHFDLGASVRRRALVLYAIALAALVGGGLIWWALDGGTLAYSAARLRYLWGLSRDSGLHIAVRPGDWEVLAGSDLEVQAEITGFTRTKPSLHVITDGQERAYAMERPDSLGAKGGRAARGHADYRTVLARLDRDITYFVKLGDETTPVFRVSVKEEPRITAGKITLAYPSYTELGQEVLPQGDWDINAPYGTRARFELVANCAPEQAWISLGGEGGRAWEESLQVMGDSMVADLRLAEDMSYTLEMLAGGGLRAKPHGPHAIRVVTDKSPFVRIESPAREIMLEADMMIPLSVVALDDYGISMMRLVYETKGEKGQLPLVYHGKTQARCDWTWDISHLDIFPGEALSYYVEVADNDALTGPKYARTDVYTARVPTIYDAYQEIENRQDADVASLEEAADKAKELKEDLDKIAEDMKRQPAKSTETGWEQEQAIKQNLDQQEALAKQLDETASRMDQTLDLMSQNKLVNFDVIEKMEEIRKLLAEVANEDMMKALEKMREAMANLTPEEIKAALENMTMNQEDLLRKLDKTIEILKRMQLEQRMEAALNLANSLAEGQKQVNDQLAEGQDLNTSADQEKALSADAAKLKDMLKGLQDLLKTQKNPVGDQVAKADEFMDSSGIQQGMGSMTSQMSGGKRSGALSQGQNVEQNLDQLAAMLKEASEALNSDEKKQILQALNRTLNSLRDVSERQEDVLSEIDRPDPDVSRAEMARQEMVYKEALDRVAEDMFELSKKSLFVGPTVGRTILAISRQVEEASKSLTERTGLEAHSQVKASLGALNQMITGLMDAMDKASSCSSPSGMCEAFDSLESMCSAQLGINQGTQQLMGQGDQGQQGLSMEARAQMARLAAQQEMVKKGLEDLSGQYGNQTEILGRMDDLAQEARRVVEDLKKQSVSEETIQRQQKILTRMLDAQKSLRKRDYSQRRRSRPGENYQVASPPPLSIEERERVVRDLLYKGRGYYPPEYEELIRAYFKAIAATKPQQ
ncbi:MAG TPA: hypothetical protein VMU02_07700 [bacterium]|nr:hypothetical protein [bacterium]